MKPQYISTRILVVDGCWLWTIGLDRDGYGKGGRMVNGTWTSERAHRLSWLAFKGEIPAGMLVLHNCRNRSCVNPDHLKLGTPLENMLDRKRDGTDLAGELHPMAKLDRRAAAMIFKSLGSSHVVAKKFGVPAALVNQIRAGQIWQSVNGSKPSPTYRSRIDWTGRSDHFRAKRGALVSPDGEEFDFSNLTQWCRENEWRFIDNHPESEWPLWRRIRFGIRKSFQGWTIRTIEALQGEQVDTEQP